MPTPDELYAEQDPLNLDGDLLRDYCERDVALSRAVDDKFLDRLSRRIELARNDLDLPAYHYLWYGFARGERAYTAYRDVRKVREFLNCAETCVEQRRLNLADGLIEFAEEIIREVADRHDDLASDVYE